MPWKEVLSPQEEQWEEIPFKDFRPNDYISNDEGDSRDRFLVKQWLNNNELLLINKYGKESQWTGKWGPYFRLVTPNQSQVRSTVAVRDEWSILRSVFAPDADKPPKDIPDYPHKCPFCGSKSYNNRIKIDCTGNCEDSRKTH